MKIKVRYMLCILIVFALLLGVYIPAKEALAGSTPIMGQSEVLASQMIQYYQKNNSTYPYSNTNLNSIDAFVSQVIDEATYEGVRPDVAFAQMMKETNFLKFTGDVQVGQYNFGGLGATGGGVRGESFNNPIIGIRAVIQHLKAYATSNQLKRPQNYSQWEQPYADTRYSLVSPKGKANNTVEGLSGTWAADPNYGTDIVNRINSMKSFTTFTTQSDRIYFSSALSWRSGVNGFSWDKSKEISGDFNGDGKSDVAILYNYGNNNTGLFVFTSDGTKFKNPLVWQSGVGNWSWDRSKVTSGDFDKDGKDEIAVLYNYGNNNTGLLTFDVNGTYITNRRVWLSGVGNWSWDRGSLTSGDYNKDGKDEIAVMYNYGNNNTGIFTFNFGVNGTYVSPTRVWLSGVGNWSWDRSKLTSGDYNKDGKDDIAILYNYGNNNTALFTFDVNGTYIINRRVWQSGVGGWSWDRSKLTSGDYNNDGQNEIVIMYNYGNNNTGIFTFDVNGTSATNRLVWQSGAGNWSWDRSKLTAGDFVGDTRKDLAVVYDYGNSTTGILTFGSVDHKYTVVLDPGHGGYDPGAVANGLHESDINLGVALKVRDILSTKGYNVSMTRYDDTFVGLQERADFSNSSGGDIFVSLHSDSSSSTSATGSMGTYYHWGEGYATDNYNAVADANWQLNKDLAQKLAYNVAINTGQNQRPSESHSFAVLWRNNLPATLIEMGFISNPTTASQMATYDWQYRTANGIANGIDSYFSAHP